MMSESKRVDPHPESPRRSLSEKLALLKLVPTPEEVERANGLGIIEARQVSPRFFRLLYTLIEACKDALPAESELEQILAQTRWYRELDSQMRSVVAGTTSFVEIAIAQISASELASGDQVRAIRRRLRELQDFPVPDIVTTPAIAMHHFAGDFFALQEAVVSSCKGDEPLLNYDEIKHIMRRVGKPWQRHLLGFMKKISCAK